MTKEKNKKKSPRSLVTTCFFILILAGSFLFAKDSLAVPNNYNKNATSTLVAAEWNNLISDFVNTFGTSTMIGPLGIGTNVPNYRLTVTDGSIPEFSAAGVLVNNVISIQGSGAAYFMGRDITNDIEFMMGTSNAGVAFAGSITNHDFQLRTNNVNRLTIQKTTGNIGINNASPNDIFSIGNSGSAPAGSPNTGHNFTSTYLTADDYALTNYGLVKTLIASATSSISNLWGGVASGHIWNLNTGNTGIGTTTPLFKFEVSGTFKVSTSSSSIILDSGGNVLIGI